MSVRCAIKTREKTKKKKENRNKRKELSFMTADGFSMILILSTNKQTIKKFVAKRN